MTIKLEQEAILRAFDTTTRSPLSCHPQHPLKPPLNGVFRSSYGESPSLYYSDTHETGNLCPDLVSLDSDEDCISLSSSDSRSSFGGESITGRRVSFASKLVTDVKTRPFTKACDKRQLFYTSDETARFRQIYREERLSISNNHDVQNVHTSDSSSPGRRRISRVVVDHKDGQTFYDDLPSYSPQDDGASLDVFFDNDKFWEGSITWYWQQQALTMCHIICTSVLYWALSSRTIVYVSKSMRRTFDMYALFLRCRCHLKLQVRISSKKFIFLRPLNQVQACNYFQADPWVVDVLFWLATCKYICHQYEKLVSNRFHVPSCILFTHISFEGEIPSCFIIWRVC